MIEMPRSTELTLEALAREQDANAPCDAVERDRQWVEQEISRRRSDAFWAGVFAAVDAENDLEWEEWLSDRED